MSHLFIIVKKKNESTLFLLKNYCAYDSKIERKRACSSSLFSSIISDILNDSTLSQFKQFKKQTNIGGNALLNY